MKCWEELIRENAFGTGGHRDHLPACLAHMLYCIVAEKPYNLAYFFIKRIECARKTPKANLPYGMFLTRLYRQDTKLCNAFVTFLTFTMYRSSLSISNLCNS